jgi:hypothetical protein
LSCPARSSLQSLLPARARARTGTASLTTGKSTKYQMPATDEHVLHQVCGYRPRSLCLDVADLNLELEGVEVDVFLVLAAAISDGHATFLAGDPAGRSIKLDPGPLANANFRVGLPLAGSCPCTPWHALIIYPPPHPPTHTQLGAVVYLKNLPITLRAGERWARCTLDTEALFAFKHPEHLALKAALEQSLL